MHSASVLKKNTIEWDGFKKFDKYYTENRFYYHFTKYSNQIFYKEYCNNTVTKSLSFDNAIYVEILRLCNFQIRSFHNLFNELQKTFAITKNDLETYIRELHEEHLVYCNESFNKIISIVDPADII